MLRIIILGGVFGLGVVVGWLLSERYPAEPGEPPISDLSFVGPTPGELIETGAVDAALAALARDPRAWRTLLGHLRGSDPETFIQWIVAFQERFGESADTLLELSRHHESSGDYVRALDAASAAAYLAPRSARADARIDALLNASEADAFARGEIHRFDAQLEQVTLAFPEKSRHLFRLGTLRIRTGEFAKALGALAQIENHAEFGGVARQLRAQTEAALEGRDTANTQVPLRRSGDQYIATVLIDDRQQVDLLIDTGAAISVIDVRVLTQLGYDHRNAPKEYFATAGGVVKAPVVSLDRLAVGEAQIAPLSVAAFSLDLPSGADGLLGMNFLKQFDFRIDQVGSVLTLQRLANAD